MSIDQIIFFIMKSNAHNWVRYFYVKEISGLTMPGEYIEIRSSFISNDVITILLNSGFNIQKITSQKIDADAYVIIFLKREI